MGLSLGSFGDLFFGGRLEILLGIVLGPFLGLIPRGSVSRGANINLFLRKYKDNNDPVVLISTFTKEIQRFA